MEIREFFEIMLRLQLTFSVLEDLERDTDETSAESWSREPLLSSA